MSQHLHGVAVYNPDLLSKEELLRLFIARQPLLARLVTDLRAETGGLPQHHLIVGRRGMGKTTLLRRLRYAIEDEPELDAHWLPLVFPEEQYNVANLSDFWLNCVDALADALESRNQRESLAALDEQISEIASIADEADRRARALGLLLSLSDRIARRLVLLVDNLDLVFSRFEQDDWAVRETLSREPRLLLIGATSQALESSFRYDKAFYDFFRIHELDGLDEAQTFEVMRHLAQVTEQPRVLDVIEHQPGRIQTLRLLSGGNPRTLVLLFNLLAQGTEGDARSDLERLLDQITPLYKHRFEELPAQAQRVVDGLALGWDPMTAREVADRLRLDINQTSAQLNRLVKQGVVEKTRLPGKSRTGFQLSERLFNIWYLMRASRRMRRRLIFLVKFLELFFPPEELRAQAMRRLRAQDGSRSADYGFALAQAMADSGLRHALEIHSLRAVLVDPRGELREILDLDGDDRTLAPRVERIAALIEAERAILAADRQWPEGLDCAQFWELLGGSISLNSRHKRRIAKSLSKLSDSQMMDCLAFIEAERRVVATILSSQDSAAEICALIQHGYIDPPFASADIDSIIATEASPKACALLYAIRGMELCFNQMFQQAEAAYRRAIEIDPHFSFPWYVLANLLTNNLSRFDEAEAAYRRAIEIDPNVASSWYELGDLLQDHLSRFDEAEVAYRHAIEIDADFAYSWTELANLLQDHLSRFDEAEAAYRRAIEIDPNLAYPWSGLARLLHYCLFRFDEAELAYRRAIEIDPNFAYLWGGLANLLRDHHSRFGEAEAAYLRAIEIDPNDAFLWYGLADLLRDHLSRFDAAEAAYLRAIEIDSNDAYPWNGLAELLKKLSRFDEAEAAYRRAIEIDPNDACSWSDLADLLQDKLARFDEAEATYRRAIEINPSVAPLWQELGALLQDHLSRFDEAAAAYRHAIEIDPNFAHVWYTLANLLQNHLSHYEEAHVAYNRTLELAANNPQLLNACAWELYVYFSDLDAAEEAAQKAIDHSPSDPYYTHTLACIQAARGQWPGELARLFLSDERSRREFWDDILIFFSEVVRHGHAGRARELLLSFPEPEAWTPLVAALEAIEHENSELLLALSPEMRAAAELALSRIAPEFAR